MIEREAVVASKELVNRRQTGGALLPIGGVMVPIAALWYI